MSSSQMAIPARPHTVIRVGFAGRRDLSDHDRSRLRIHLAEVILTIGREAAAHSSTPRVRLVTGLCEGADAAAADALGDTRREGGAFETEIAAVLPCDVDAYRKSRPESFHEDFDKTLKSCSWVQVLDGICDKPATDTPEASRRRGRAYRAQSAFLLRHSDVIVAAPKADEAGKAGGTWETVKAAWELGIPVVLVDAEGVRPYASTPGDLVTILREPAPKDWATTVRIWVRDLVAGSRLDAPRSSRRHAHSGSKLTDEFFDPTAVPRSDGKRKITIAEQIWSEFTSSFQPKLPLKTDTGDPYFQSYRRRAADLSNHYMGRYRGKFFLNYLLAVCAVALAALSLGLLSTCGRHEPTTDPSPRDIPTLAVTPPAAVPHALRSGATTRAHAAESAAMRSGAERSISLLHVALAVLAAFKLAILIIIARNVHIANSQQWARRGVAYRYLAERLRAQLYLARAGIYGPPAVAMTRFTQQSVRQSEIEHLFNSILRGANPADSPFATSPLAPNSTKKLLTVNSAGAAACIRDDLILEQAKYHEKTSLTMSTMHEELAKVAQSLSTAAIAVVLLDIAVLAVELLHLAPWADHILSPATPWLLCLSAVLPAFVAGVNGVASQAECERLADQSAVMRTILIGPPAGPIPEYFPGSAEVTMSPTGGHWMRANELVQRITAATASASNPGAWCHDVLTMAEAAASDFAHEVSAWSVFYEKELREVG